MGDLIKRKTSLKKGPKGLVKKGKSALGGLRKAAIRSGEYMEALALILDNSASMGMRDLTAFTSRMESVKLAVRSLLDEANPATSRIAVISFSERPRSRVPLTNNYTMVRDGLNQIEPHSCTQIEPALRMGNDILLLQDVKLRRMIVLSDGEAQDALNALAWAESAKQSDSLPIIDTIYFSDTDYGKELMVKLAEISGGKFYYAQNAKQLATTFKQLEAKTRGLLTDGR